MQIIDGAKKQLTYEEISVRMRKNSWIKARWPDYNENMARGDLLDNLSLVEDDIRSLASIYMVRHLDIIHNSIDRMEEIADDVDEKPHVRIAATNAIGPMLEKSIRIFGNYQATEVKIDKRSVDLNLDAYLRIQKKARAEAQEEIFEGEIEEVGESHQLKDGNTFSEEEE